MEDKKVKNIKNGGCETHYFSGKLKKKLDRILYSSSVIVEAPSGYGKTTAVRDFLKTGLPSRTPVFWLTSVEETPSSAFNRLCREIERIDGEAGKRLMKIGLPNAATAGEACDAIRSIQCGMETYLVLDNFQYIQNSLPVSFCAALIGNGNEALHVIIITQTLRLDIHKAIAGTGFLYLTAADLSLGEKDITDYFSLAGFKITAGDTKLVMGYTGGWIIAVYLQMCSLRDTGGFTQTAVIRLTERLVWDALSEEQRIFMMRVSYFVSFTVPQACFLSEYDDLPEYARRALDSPLIRYDEDGRRYEMHSLLLDMLAGKREQYGLEFRAECLVRAGDYCRGLRKTAEAVGFYIQAGDYERILSLDFSEILLEEIGNRRFPDIALQIARECPPKIKGKHILSMLRVSWTLKLTGEENTFRGLMEELRPVIENGGDLKLLGELTLLDSYESYPDTEAMTEILKKAEILFGGDYSRVILPSAPWCFGDTNPLRVFYTTPGEAEKEADALDEYLSIYTKLTKGHGSGGGALYRAWLAYCRGDFKGSEILAYKAAYLSENNKQGIVLIGSSYLLAEIALHNADTAGWQNAVASMERAAQFAGQNNYVTRAVIDITRAQLFNQLDNNESDAEWLKKGEFENILPAMFSSAIATHIGYLLRSKKYAQLIGKAQAVINKRDMRKPHNLIVLSFMTAVSHLNMGDREKARAAAEQAIETAMPDDMVDPIAAYSWLLDGLVEEILKDKYPGVLKRFFEVKDHFGTGWEALFNDMFREGPPSSLTEREREIAALAAQSMRNTDIAEKLGISVNTVKAHLKSIYEKLAIDKRSRLREKLK